MTRFGFIRHAQTTWNAEKRIQGQTDTLLSEDGKSDAARWGESLAKQQPQWKWNRILCSSLTRAVHTADIINERLTLPVTFDVDLQEQDWGHWTGRTIRQLREEESGEVERQEAAGWHFTPTGGESRLEVRHRMHAALTRAAAQWPEENILVVTHLGCIKCVFCHALTMTFLPDEPSPVKKYGLHIADMQDDNLRVVSVNNSITG